MTLDSRFYIDDIVEEKMQCAAILRSTIRSGTVDGLQPPDIPAGYRLIRRSDIPGSTYIELADSRIPVLADTIAYRGQPIAIICGPEDHICRELVEATEVHYSRYEPIDLESSSAPVRYERDLEAGNAKATAETAFQFTEAEYRFNTTRYKTLESMGAHAIVDKDGIVVTVPTRWHYHVRDSVAKVLGRPLSDVSLTACSIEAAADGFLWRPSLLAAIAAIASVHTGTPVMLFVGPSNLGEIATGPEAKIRYKSELDVEGNHIAASIDVVGSTGAYSPFGREYIDRICIALKEAYDCEHVEIAAKLVETNTAPTEMYRGFGLSAALFAAEVHATRLAELSGADSIDWRTRHILRRRTRDKEKSVFESASKDSDFRRKHAAYETAKKRRGHAADFDLPLRGIGVARGFTFGGFLNNSETSSVHTRLDSEGTLEIATASALRDSSSRLILRRLASKALGMEETAVIFAESPKTSSTAPTLFGHNIAVSAKLLAQCVDVLNKQRFRSPLPIEVRRSSRRKSSSRWNPLTLEGNPFTAKSEIVTVVEVEVDSASLHPILKGVWCALDVGHVFDKRIAKRTVFTELAEAFELCRDYEQVWEESGQAIARGVPSIRFLNDDHPDPKPVEGLAVCSFVPAFFSAISQATSYYFDTVPLKSRLLHSYTEK